MDLNVCKLEPITPLHLGEREAWNEGSNSYIHADTLYSAICHCIRLVYGEVKLNTFITATRNQRFKISSAFPYWNDKYYWPIPKNQIPDDKALYKIQFIETNGLVELLQGKNLKQVFQVNDCIPDKKEPTTPWSLFNAPRISLDRYSNQPVEEGGYFHVGRIRYVKNAGLFFIYDILDKEVKKIFTTALRLLADEGIGGDRSVGNGLFMQPKYDQINLDTPNNVNATYTLSLFSPSEMDDLSIFSNSFYEMKERKGYIYSPNGSSLRRRTVRMFLEGSVFSNNTGNKGQLVNVKPDIFSDHQVYRYGIYWGLPCKMEVD